MCDRGADRVQVFRKDGTYVREVVYNPATLNQGSTWDIACSCDEEPPYTYLADGLNFTISGIDCESMEVN